MRWVAKYNDGTVIQEGAQRYADLQKKPDVLELVDGDGNVVESVKADSTQVPFYRIRTTITPSGQVVGRFTMIGLRQRRGDRATACFTVIYSDGRKEVHDEFQGIFREPDPWYPFEQVAT